MLSLLRLVAPAALTFAALPLLALAQQPDARRDASAPPAYQKLRYDEDYAYLEDPSRRSDFWDPFKFIPLNDAGDAYFSLGGEGRWRYERYHDYQWDPEARDDGGYLLQRYLLSGDLHLSAWFRAFAQLQSSLEEWRAGGPRPTDRDRLDLHQLFGDVRLPLDRDDDTLTLRVGRQEMLYGSQRLVSVRESPNIRRSFDAVRLLTRYQDWRVDAFAARPVQDEPGVFDDWKNPHAGFWGLYATHPLRAGLNLDLYYLGIWNRDAEFAQGSGHEERHSLGARLFGEWNGWDCNFEGVLQFGSFAGSEILAWTFASDTGYTFAAAPLAPRIGLKSAAISGDGNPDHGKLGTFNPLFPRGAYFSEAALVWPANLLDVDPTLELQLTEHVGLTADWDVFWRYSSDDALYTGGGNVARPPDGDARFIGHQPSVTLSWQVDRHASFNVAYTHFFAGGFIRESGPDTDVDFVGAWLLYRF